MTSGEDERGLSEFILSNPDLHGKRLMDLKFPANILVLAIRREDEVIVPHGTTRLAARDLLTAPGDLEALSTAEEWLEKW